MRERERAEEGMKDRYRKPEIGDTVRKGYVQQKETKKLSAPEV